MNDMEEQNTVMIGSLTSLLEKLKIINNEAINNEDLDTMRKVRAFLNTDANDYNMRQLRDFVDSKTI